MDFKVYLFTNTISRIRWLKNFGNFLLNLDWLIKTRFVHNFPPIVLSAEII